MARRSSPVRRSLRHVLMVVFPLVASAANCAQDGSSYSYTEVVSGSTRTITTNHCPNHPYYNMNPNVAVDSSRTYRVPALPQFVGSVGSSSAADANIDLSEKGGAVGVFFNAAMLYSPFGGPSYGQTTGWTTSATYAEGNTFDQCGCHASSTTSPSYHCHVPPSCLLQQLGQTDTTHSPQIGWAFDGFPVYGPRGPGGVMMQTCTESGGVYGTDVCTDDCGGFYFVDGSIDEFVYRYYVLGEYSDGASCDLPGCPSPTSAYFPNTMMCYRGCCPSGMSCPSGITTCPSSNVIDGYTSSYTAEAATVNGLSVASGLPQNNAGCACDGLACSSCQTNGWSSSSCGAGNQGSWDNSCPAVPATPAPTVTGATPAPTSSSSAADASASVRQEGLGLFVNLVIAACMRRLL